MYEETTPETKRRFKEDWKPENTFEEKLPYGEKLSCIAESFGMTEAQATAFIIGAIYHKIQQPWGESEVESFFDLDGSIAALSKLGINCDGTPIEYDDEIITPTRERILKAISILSTSALELHNIGSVYPF